MKIKIVFIAIILLMITFFSNINPSLSLIQSKHTFPSNGSITYPIDDPRLHTEGSTILDSSGRVFIPYGINTATTYYPPNWSLDRPPEQPTSELLDKLRSLKVNLVRINVCYRAWMEEAGYKEYIDKWVNGLAEIGIRSYLDLHALGYANEDFGTTRFEWIYEVMTNLTEKQKVFDLYNEWIDRYRNQPYMVGIGIMNEPTGWPEDYSFPVTESELKSVWRNFVIDAIAYIHSINPDLLVFVNGDGINWGCWLEAFVDNVPAKGNVVYTFHHYPEYELLYGENDAYPNYYISGDSVTGKSKMASLLQWSVFDLLNDNVPILCTEFGFSDPDGLYNNWQQCFDDFYEICYSKGVGVVQWSLPKACDDFGVLGGDDWLFLTQVGQKWAENLEIYSEGA